MPSASYVVKNIIGVCVIMVAAQQILFLSGVNIQKYLALHFITSPDFKWWQFLTYMFMHGAPGDMRLTISHIFFNMFGLYMFGSILENAWGYKRFLIFFLICGFGAALCQMGVVLWEFSHSPGEIGAMISQYWACVGASGAVMGILFAFAYLYPNTELYLMFIPVPVKAKWAVTGYVVLELVSGIGNFSGDNVAHFAHLGGMLFAFIILQVWKRDRKNFY